MSLAENLQEGQPQIYVMHNEEADTSKVDATDFVGIVCRGENAYTLSVDGKL